MEAPPKQDNYEVALRLARQDLAGADLVRAASLAGARVIEGEGEAVLEISFMGAVYRVSGDPPDMVPAPGGTEPAIWEKVLILHYLKNAVSDSPTGKWINFSQVPSGQFYLSAFNRRGPDLAVQFFSRDLEDFARRARALGATKYDLGEAAFVFDVLPKVPVLVVLYAGDEEFPPACNVLFDETVPSFLCTEDIAVVTTMLMVKLRKLPATGPGSEKD